MSSTIWISRVSPWDFAAAGVMRYTLWFEKPVYKPALFACPVFGPVKPTDYYFGGWELNRSGIPLHCLRKRNPEFIQRVFQDTLSQCYIPVPDAYQDDPYTYLLDKYDTAKDALLDRQRNISDPDDLVAKAAREAHKHEMVKQAERAIEREGKGWREHLLEYDLTLTLR